MFSHTAKAGCINPCVKGADSSRAAKTAQTLGLQPLREVFLSTNLRIFDSSDTTYRPVLKIRDINTAAIPSDQTATIILSDQK
jgi:hypothetical protein